MMLTPDEAYALTDPNLSEEQRISSAQTLIASAAANAAYWDSRSPLEQIVAKAQGADVIPSHAELNDPNAGAVEGTASQTAITDATVVADEADAELKAAEERVAAIKASKGA